MSWAVPPITPSLCPEVPAGEAARPWLGVAAGGSADVAVCAGHHSPRSPQAGTRPCAWHGPADQERPPRQPARESGRAEQGGPGAHARRASWRRRRQVLTVRGLPGHRAHMPGPESVLTLCLGAGPGPVLRELRPGTEQPGDGTFGTDRREGKRRGRGTPPPGRASPPPGAPSARSGAPPTPAGVLRGRGTGCRPEGLGFDSGQGHARTSACSLCYTITRPAPSLHAGGEAHRRIPGAEPSLHSWRNPVITIF